MCIKKLTDNIKSFKLTENVKIVSGEKPIFFVNK